MASAQLSVMVNNLRAEAGHALGVAQGNNNYETLKYLLARTQEELWTAYVWPELSTWQDFQLTPGQYHYPEYPPGVTFDGIRKVYTCPEGSTTPEWVLVNYGMVNPNATAPGGAMLRSDPVTVWDVAGGGSGGYTVYPAPDTATWLRFSVQQQLHPFTADADVSTLDATLIVLFTAADLLARAKAEDAPTKMAKAQRHLLKLLGSKISAKHKVSSLGGGSPAGHGSGSDVNFGYGGRV